MNSFYEWVARGLTAAILIYIVAKLETMQNQGMENHTSIAVIQEKVSVVQDRLSIIERKLP